jgi:glycosyltransferase involved in cell wall biosynthesis
MILYVVSRLEESGPINQAYEIVKRVNKDIDVLSLSGGDDVMIEKFRDATANVTILSDAESRSFLQTLREFRKFIQVQSPQVVHSHGFRPDFLAGLTIHSVPTVSTLHTVPQWDYPLEYGKIGYGLGPVHQLIEAGISCSVACSKTVADNTIWSDRIVHNGIDESIFHPVSSTRRTELREELDINTDSPVFVTVGRMIERKDPKTVINGFLAADCSSDAQLLLVGGGNLTKECREMAADYDEIRIEGYVEKVRPYLQAADYFVSASHAEGLPLSVLEAMGCGLPAVLSDIGPHNEILANADHAGTLFELGSQTSLSEELSNIDHLDSNAARTVVEGRFTADRMADEYSRIYDDLL